MSKPLKQCNHAGCRALIPYDTSYCDKHKKSRFETYNKHRWKTKKEYLQFYNSKAWRQLSHVVKVETFNICERCGAEGTVSDHIIPTEVDWNKRLERENIQRLCDSCHAIKTHEDKRKYNI
ncbi:HNH endonuclease [Vagococcus lutrae]|uniref:HNH endonuclease n=1 Tax=Vagococcus lutrae TaxID=81947 RepID=UPI0035DF4F55